MDDILEDMIRDVGAKSFVEAVYKNMSNYASALDLTTTLCFLLFQEIKLSPIETQ